MIISSERFVPHTLEHLIEAKVFPTSLPEEFYSKICKEYESVTEATTNRITYQSGDLKVTGIICLPSITNAKKHPIMIYNRGGNKEYGKLTVLSVVRSMLPFVRKNYLTYASNYRGNDGGEGTDEFGGADVDDVLNLLEIAKQNPAWDGQNIFMLGHSRGGMMTYMCLRKNKEINAAVSIAGVSSILQSGNDRPELEQNIFQKLIKVGTNEREQAYIERSAIYWANEINAPVLLLHGTSDDAVDIIHSINLDKKLTEYHKRHELIIYEGGNHALLRFWSEVLEKSILWFERYRK